MQKMLASSSIFKKKKQSIGKVEHHYTLCAFSDTVVAYNLLPGSFVFKSFF